MNIAQNLIPIPVAVFCCNGEVRVNWQGINGLPGVGLCKGNRTGLIANRCPPTQNDGDMPGRPTRPGHNIPRGDGKPLPGWNKAIASRPRSRGRVEPSELIAIAGKIEGMKERIGPGDQAHTLKRPALPLPATPATTVSPLQNSRGKTRIVGRIPWKRPLAAILLSILSPKCA